MLLFTDIRSLDAINGGKDTSACQVYLSFDTWKLNAEPRDYRFACYYSVIERKNILN